MAFAGAVTSSKMAAILDFTKIRMFKTAKKFLIPYANKRNNLEHLSYFPLNNLPLLTSCLVVLATSFYKSLPKRKERTATEIGRKRERKKERKKKKE